MDEPDCYAKASAYWAAIPATVDGMLGGLSKVSAADIAFSEHFLEHAIDKGYLLERGTVVDVGAGIGRITKHLLTKHFDAVDLLEADDHFLTAAPSYLGSAVMKKVRNIIPQRLQDYRPEPESLDCVWCQWVLPHLRDDDLVASLVRLKKSLRPTSNGLIFVKENLAKAEDEFDPVDNSVTRTRERYLELFEKAGLTLVREGKQNRFPTELYEVRLFSLQ